MTEQPAKRLSPRQQRLIISIDRGIYHLARHWLWLLNGVGAIMVGLPLLAPYLAAHGHGSLARGIYAAFSLVCHQEPEHSFFVFGHKMAYCERDTAIYGGLLLFGLIYAALRSRIRPLGLWGAVLLALPMALDGFTQLAGLRESTWELRVITGSIFALAVAWLVFPRLELGFLEIRTILETRFDRLANRGLAKPLRHARQHA